MPAFLGSDSGVPVSVLGVPGSKVDPNKGSIKAESDSEPSVGTTPPCCIETCVGFFFKKKSLLIAYQIVDELVILL